MARVSAEQGDSLFKVTDNSDLARLDDDESEGEVGQAEVVLLAVRTLTILLLIGGSALLTFKVWRRGRGSWREAAVAVSIQMVWQVLAWYRVHLDQHWVFALTRGTPDHESTRKIFQFVENLFHGMAVYSGLVVVGRLGAVVGALLYILSGLAILVPLLFSIIILLLDIYLNAGDRVGLGSVTPMAVATLKMVLMDLVPVGLLLAWGVGQCSTKSKGRKGTREVASTVIAVMLLLWHITSFAQWVVYMVSANSGVLVRFSLVDYDRGLLEAAYLLACLALPWAWLLGLLLPSSIGGRRSSMDELDLNLKAAKQNERRNVINIKYKKENGDFPMATPPTSPQRFSPSITSSPSTLSASTLVKTQALPPHLTPTTPAKGLPQDDGKGTPKRRSYMEAVSNSELNMNPMNTSEEEPKSKITPRRSYMTAVSNSELNMNPRSPDEEEPTSKITPRRSYMTAVSNSEINMLEDAPPRQAKSADPLWLPNSKPSNNKQSIHTTSKPVML